MLIVYIFLQKNKFHRSRNFVYFERRPTSAANRYCTFPPDDLGSMSVEGSANKDDGMKNVNQLGKGLLSQKGELVLHCNEDKLDENDV